jgi:hypothetical protein
LDYRQQQMKQRNFLFGGSLSAYAKATDCLTSSMTLHLNYWKSDLMDSWASRYMLRLPRLTFPSLRRQVEHVEPSSPLSALPQLLHCGS